ncbi:MAG TPA: hypothetical protein VF553_20860 [Pyrinomonadaceae bacterium]|jgi:hypothetical protein
MFRRNVQKAHEEETVIERPPGPLSRLLVAASLVDTSLKGLRGYVPREGLCYWLGREVEAGVGLVTVVAFPQIYSTEYSFELAPGQMAEINTRAAREGVFVIAQVHTHPTDEPHSDADEEWSPTRRPGFISIVIPFGAQFSNLRTPRLSCYECDANGQWMVAREGLVSVYDDIWLSGELS